MKFTRKIQLSNSSSSISNNSLQRIERHLQKQDFRPEREANKVSVKLFTWSEIFSGTDPDRFSWNSLHLEHSDETLHLRMKYNWALQAIAHIAMSVFVTAFVNRFGSSEAVLPMLLSMNAVLAVVSYFWAHTYAKKLAGEIQTIAMAESASDAWFKSA